MSDCLFCKIVAGEIPADVVLDRGSIVAFRDRSLRPERNEYHLSY